LSLETNAVTGPTVAVCGLGAVSCAGIGVEPLWRAIVEQRVLTGPVSRYDVTRYPTQRAGELPAAALNVLDERAPPHASLAGRYLAAAALEALTNAGIAATSRQERLGVFIGTVMGTRPALDQGIGSGVLTVANDVWTRPDALLSPLREVVEVNGPAVITAPGCAAGNSAIAVGAAAIRGGEVDVAVCGGVDELSLEIFALFTSLRALEPETVRPFDVDRRGMMPGEGAGVLVLEPVDRALAHGRQPLARVLSWASAADAYSMTQPHPDGVGVVLTINTCLRRARLDARDIDWVCAHGTGTPASDGVEMRAITMALPAPRRPVVSSIKGQLGHAQGAAAALEAVVAVRAIADNYVPGNATLLSPDPACATVDLVEPTGRVARVDYVLNLAFGFGGCVSTILLGSEGRHG
jgi:3-oxoacyl-(acyl-carrier-protein) synthase